MEAPVAARDRIGKQGFSDEGEAIFRGALMPLKQQVDSTAFWRLEIAPGRHLRVCCRFSPQGVIRCFQNLPGRVRPYL